jgi:hypothetical protein
MIDEAGGELALRKATSLIGQSPISGLPRA